MNAALQLNTVERENAIKEAQKESKKLKLVETDIAKFERIFTGTAGEHFVVTKQGDRMRHNRNKDLFYNPHSQEENRYITFNTFGWEYVDGELTFPRRRKKFLKQVNALWVDLDIYNVGMSKEYALAKIKIFLEDNNIFYPTCIIDSGNGLYLVWKIEPQLVNSNVFLKKYEKLLKKLRYLFREFGADSKSAEATHLLRLPSTINNVAKPGIKDSDKDKVVEILEINDYVYTTWEFNRELYKNGLDEEEFYKKQAKQILKNLQKIEDSERIYKEKGERWAKENEIYRLTGKPFKQIKWELWGEGQPPKPKKARSKFALLRTAHNYRETIKLDFRRIQEMRNRKDINTGYREMLAFVYANVFVTSGDDNDNLSIDKEKLKELHGELSKFNALFNYTLEESEIENIVTEMENREEPYKFKNATLIEFLQINRDEMKEMKVLINEEEKKDRHRIYMNKMYEPIKEATQKETKNRDNEVIKLYKQGVKQVDIVKQTGIPKSTVGDILKPYIAKDNKKRDESIIELYKQGVNKTKIAKEVGTTRPTINSVINKFETSI